MYPPVERRPSPPPLAIAICAYEACAAGLAILGQMFLLIAFLSHPLRKLPTSMPWVMALGWISALLAIAGAITLWQLRRAAFAVLATRLVLSLSGYAFSLLHPVQRTAALGNHGRQFLVVLAVTRVIGILFLILNAAICWYAFEVTKMPVYPPYAPPTSPDTTPFL